MAVKRIKKILKNKFNIKKQTMAVKRIKKILKNKFNINNPHYSTYSQFGEDVIIYAYFREKRVYKEGRGKESLQKGFYVDIGAFDPFALSNTFKFSQLGWNGINVDASEGAINKFNLYRKNDTNILSAVGIETGDVVFYNWGTQGVFNTIKKDRADEVAKSGIFDYTPKETLMKCVSLEEILSQKVPKNKKVDFLSVDVEGADLDVLQSNDWATFRPELVICEDLKFRFDSESCIKSTIVDFMLSKGYRIHAIATPSIIFVDGNI